MRDLKNIARFVATLNLLQGKKFTYGHLDRFLKKELGTGPVIIISIQKQGEELEKVNEKFRTVWNKKCIRSYYTEKDIEAIFSDITSFKIELGKYPSNGKTFFTFMFGESGNQIFYGIFELQREVSSEVLDIFSLFIRNLWTNWLSFEELKKVENLVYIDDVSGLYNQRKLLKDIDVSIERFHGVGEVFSILFIDIDHFKNVNDTLGHVIGTQVLFGLGQLLQKVLRETDLVYRYGGDEFVMILPDVNGEVARSIAQRVLDNIKGNKFYLKKEGKNQEIPDFLNISVSIGVASYPKDAKNKDEILSIADKMMYEAKKKGRGRVCYTTEILEN